MAIPLCLESMTMDPVFEHIGQAGLLTLELLNDRDRGIPYSTFLGITCSVCAFLDLSVIDFTLPENRMT